MSLLWDLQPEAGLDLVDDWSGDGGPEGGPSFALELDDEVMEQLIQNAMGGEEIELELGDSPVGTTSSYYRSIVGTPFPRSCPVGQCMLG